jgi:hypothetical protein
MIKLDGGSKVMAHNNDQSSRHLYTFKAFTSILTFPTVRAFLYLTAAAKSSLQRTSIQRSSKQASKHQPQCLLAFPNHHDGELDGRLAIGQELVLAPQAQQ